MKRPLYIHQSMKAKCSLMNVFLLLAYNLSFSETLRYGATFTMHSGTHRFDVNTFDGMHSDGKLRLSMIVTADECYPVAQKIFGDDGKGKVPLR